MSNFQPFDSTSESWDSYEQRFNFYLISKGITSESKKIACLVTEGGKELFGKIETWIYPRKIEDLSYADLLETVRAHQTSKKSIIVERYKFHKLVQAQNESCRSFVDRLKAAAKHCKFNDFLPYALRDQFVIGIKDIYCEKLLACDDDLSLDKAIQLVESLELSMCETEKIRGSNVGHETVGYVHQHAPPNRSRSPSPRYRCGSRSNIKLTKHSQPTHFEESIRSQSSRVGSQQPDHSQSQRRSQPSGNRQDASNHEQYQDRDRDAHRGRGQRIDQDRQTRCHRCTGFHNPVDCKFINANCYYCGTRGHIAKACRKSLAKPVYFVNSVNNVVRVIDEPIIHLVAIAVNVDVSCNIPFIVDTGSPVSIISSGVARHYRLFDHYKLRLCDIALKGYSGQPIEVLGEIMVSVPPAGPLRLVVVKGNAPALMGREWLRVLSIPLSLGSSPVRGCFHIESESPSTVLRPESEFPKLYAEGLGRLQGIKPHLTLKPGAVPKFCRARTVPYSLRKAIEEELDSMVAEGLAERVSFSEWATPVVPVHKKDGSVRLCGDYKITLNPELQVNQYPLPTPEDLFATLNGGRVFSKLDLAKAYHQVELSSKSQDMTTINTHKGLYKLLRLPFGIAPAPAIFQEILDKLVVGIPGVCVYLDDILVMGPSIAEHNHRVRQVLRKLEDAGFRLSAQKCQFSQKEVEFLGHRIDAEGVHPMPSKVEALQKAKAPQDRKQLRSFLGLVTYYHKFIPNLATVARPLYDLLKEVPWSWGAPQQETFEKLKCCLSSKQVLVHYDPSLPLRLICDASPVGLGAVLCHVLPEGSRPVCFASRTLTETEKQYSQLEREAMAIVFGVEQFHKYVYGRRFTLVTDNKPLSLILGPKKGIPVITAARIQRWALKLAAYQYDVELISSEENAVADYLSRQPAMHSGAEKSFVVYQIQEENCPINAQTIKFETEKDVVLTMVKTKLQGKWKTENDVKLKNYHRIRRQLSCNNGCLYNGIKIVVPTKLRAQMLEELHRHHDGMVKMKTKARESMWWPGIDKDIEVVVQACHACQIHGSNPQKIPLQPWPATSKVWERIHIDFAGPMDKKMFLLVVDAYSKWMEVVPLHHTTSEVVIEHLDQLFMRYGYPETIISDNGPQFVSHETTTYLKNCGVKHITSPPYHPASNGAVERCVRNFKSHVQPEKRNGLSIEKASQKFIHNYNSMPHEATGETPSERFLGRKMRTRLSQVTEWPSRQQTSTIANTTTNSPILEPSWQERKRKEKLNKYYNVHTKPKLIVPGQAVYARSYLQPFKFEPGVVKKVLGSAVAEIVFPDGRSCKRHFNQLKPRVTFRGEGSELNNKPLEPIRRVYPQRRHLPPNRL